MIIPIRTEIARRRPTLITYWIMGVCAVVFLGMEVLQSRAPDLYTRVFEIGALHGSYRIDEAVEQQLAVSKTHGNDPLGVIDRMRLGEINPARPWQYITYQFMHAGWMHLLGNMLFLWVFGPVVEDRLRRWWFLGFYLAGGAFAGFVHGLFEGQALQIGGMTARFFVPVIGASGSIAAVTGAFLVLFPISKIDVIWFLGIIGRFAIPAWWFIALAIGRDFVMQAFEPEGVAHMAHIGGYVFGAVVALSCLALGWIPREPYNLFTMGRQAHRCRSYRELVRSHGSGFVSEAAMTKVAAPARGAGHREDHRAAKRA